jgi:hypothetical protein
MRNLVKKSALLGMLSLVLFGAFGVFDAVAGGDRNCEWRQASDGTWRCWPK